MEVSPDELNRLVGEYAYFLNLYNGPDSVEAKRFLEDHEDINEFKDLAETAMWMWQKLNHKRTK